jgi:hypothetical protein
MIEKRAAAAAFKLSLSSYRFQVIAFKLSLSSYRFQAISHLEAL